MKASIHPSTARYVSCAAATLSRRRSTVARILSVDGVRTAILSIPASRRWSTRPAASTSSARNTRAAARAEATTGAAPRPHHACHPRSARESATALDSMVRTCNAAAPWPSRLRSDQSGHRDPLQAPGARRHDRTRCLDVGTITRDQGVFSFDRPQRHRSCESKITTSRWRGVMRIRSVEAAAQLVIMVWPLTADAKR